MRSRKMQPCCRTSLTAVFSDGVIMSESFPEYRNLHAMHEQSNGACHEHGDGKEEQKSHVSLYLDAKEGQMANDSPACSRHRQNCSRPNEARCQQEGSGDQLHDS